MLEKQRAASKPRHCQAECKKTTGICINRKEILFFSEQQKEDEGKKNSKSKPSFDSILIRIEHGFLRLRTK